MNRRAFLRTTIGAVVAAQYGPGPATFGIEPRVSGFLLRGEQGEVGRWVSLDEFAAGMAAHIDRVFYDVVTGGTGFGLIGLDLASGPDETAYMTRAGTNETWSVELRGEA